MFTTDNYFDRIKVVSINSLPALLQESHQFIVKATKNGTSWAGYQSSQAIKEAIDLHLEQMQQYEPTQGSATAKRAKPKPNKGKQPKVAVSQPQAAKEDVSRDPLMVSRIPEELKFIKRFLNMHEKTLVKEQILSFINSLQKAIVEKRIRKTSEWAEQITYIQSRLILTYNTMKDKITIVLTPKTLEQYKQFVSSEKLLSSVGLIKRYISLHQKAGVKDKATALLAQIDRAYAKGSLTNNDPYTSHVLAIQHNLQNFIADKNMRALDIEPAMLSGLQGVLSGLDGCFCQPLNGLNDLPEVMNSMDFVKLDFPTIGFSGKFRDFIGDPSPGFTLMVSGPPKFGKSRWCIDFAGYLANQHGETLYVANEERLHRTLQDKIKEMQVSHPRLDVASVLPHDLSHYDYIFLDSVSLLGLTVEDLRQLKAKYPGKAFIYVFQVTKNGKFRGENTFQHDVDAVVEVHQWGKARQYGRFNQGGEMNIFEQE